VNEGGAVIFRCSVAVETAVIMWLWKVGCGGGEVLEEVFRRRKIWIEWVLILYF